MAAAISEWLIRFSHLSTARQPTAAIKAVPLIMEFPSLASSFNLGILARRMASSPLINSPLYQALPLYPFPSASQVATAAMVARGTRSPLAPREPFSGTKGVTPLLSIFIRVSTTTGRIPEGPPAMVLARITIMARTIGSANGLPIPATSARMTFLDRIPAWSGSMVSLAWEPNPVLMP